MAKVGAPYLPIRPARYKPAPVPYFQELMKAQNMLPLGITALAAGAGEEEENTGIEVAEDGRPRSVNVDDWLKAQGRDPDDYSEEEKGEMGDDLWDLVEDRARRKIEYDVAKEAGETSALEDELESRVRQKEKEGVYADMDDIIRWQETKKARGGLVGINELTRGL